MDFKGKILAVETAFEGVVLVVQQERIEIPFAKEPENTDEAILAKKIKRSMKMVGFPIEAMVCEAKSGLKTPIWLTMEDYEDMGKPTVGDRLQFRVEKFIEPETKVSKPLTPFPLEKIVMFTVNRLYTKGLDPSGVEKTVLMQELRSHNKKLSEEEIEKAVANLIREGILFEPKENYLKVVS